MQLFEIPDNPIPPGHVTGTAMTPDGVAIRHARWRGASLPFRGTIMLMQGRAECIEKYAEIVGDLLRAGYDVCTFDFRGQGGSDRLLRDRHRGYVDSIDQYVLDLDTVIRGVMLPDCRPPYYLVGHSLGGLVALCGAPLLGHRFHRMLLCAPLLQFGPGVPAIAPLRLATGLLSSIGLGQLYLRGGAPDPEKRPFAGNALTGDMARFERYGALLRAHPQLSLGGPTTGWIHAICRAMARIDDSDFIGAINLPVLMVAPGRDTVVSVRAIEDLAWRMRSGFCKTIDGARHELMFERDFYREQFLSALASFLVPDAAT